MSKKDSTVLVTFSFRKCHLINMSILTLLILVTVMFSFSTLSTFTVEPFTVYSLKGLQDGTSPKRWKQCDRVTRGESTRVKDGVGGKLLIASCY